MGKSHLYIRRPLAHHRVHGDALWVDVFYNSGLHVRIEEIETTNKKDCLLRLTRNPQEMMDFIGLDCSRYEKGFSTLDELFEWAISMPLFRRKLFEKDVISEKEERAREKRPM